MLNFLARRLAQIVPTLDQRIVWPPYFLAKDGAKVGYLIGQKDRAGLYVATEVP